MNKEELKEILLKEIGDNTIILDEISYRIYDSTGEGQCSVFHVNDYNFIEKYFNNKSLDLFQAMKSGEYNAKDEFVKFDEIGNIYSYDRVNMERCILEDKEEIIDNLIEYNCYIDLKYIDEFNYINISLDELFNN